MLVSVLFRSKIHGVRAVAHSFRCIHRKIPEPIHFVPLNHDLEGEGEGGDEGGGEGEGVRVCSTRKPSLEVIQKKS